MDYIKKHIEKQNQQIGNSNKNTIPDSLRVAIVHDYFNQNGGAEKVVETMLELYPKADLYTSTFIPENFVNDQQLTKAYLDKRVKSTWLDKIFLTKDSKKSNRIKFFKHLFFIYPIVMSFITVKDYDLVIISSTYCGKNIKLQNNGKVIHYCHSPVRFLHGLVTETDHDTLSWAQNLVISIFKPFLKWLDLKAVRNLNLNDTIWVANSNFIQKTISDVYGVDSIVIYPPVDTNRYLHLTKNQKPTEEFYLCHGRISFHKRIDLAIKSCLVLNKKLYISGTSALDSELKSLKDLVPINAKDQIVFLGRTSDQELNELICNAKAMIFPGKEDAGIAPIEMLAGGLPVIAYGAGGALEYIVDGQNGVLFAEQSEFSLSNAIKRFETLKLDTKTIKNSSSNFTKTTFLHKLEALGQI
jgi:glycosyltransferase involved in cell wall biosynthesis